MTNLNSELLKNVLSYDPDTGIFIWRKCRKIKLIGTRAGSVNKVGGRHGGGGYRSIVIGRQRYYAHRLAWLYVTGEWPIGQVDHANMRRDDNRFSNLRDVTRAENNANRKAHAHSVTGLKGVHPERGKWRARLRIGGKDLYVGRFPSAIEAHDAYCDVARKHYGENFRSA